ncbi:MAG: SDR family NAD(P)-dependent oxidoreductase [Candidatus Kapabacteria bacterium]|nr:SDR family NAD(P)-dependent oxidoreductase [Candidatus Kapabacteria bacterium]MDW8225165.1 SDR family NAD(P)-dependent oxidoreductase [Bacteroidota bacterium]
MPTVLITGASGNAGQRVTAHFLERGWSVHAHCHTPEGAERLRQTLPSGLQQRLSIATGDLAQPEAVEDYFSAAPRPVHAVVHLVGGIRAGMLLEETPPEVLAEMVQLNVTTTFLVLRAAIPLLRETKGAIVTVAAKAALHPEGRKSAYAAAKAAVIALTQAAAEEGRPYGVRANIVVPSILRTPANLEWARGGEEEQWLSLEEFAAAIFMLCSEEGRAVTGAAIPMYGGISA